jgi:putative selenium metabolism protein SsnA
MIPNGWRGCGAPLVRGDPGPSGSGESPDQYGVPPGQRSPNGCRGVPPAGTVTPAGAVIPAGAIPAGAVALVGGTVAFSLDPPQLGRTDLLIAGGRIAAVGAAVSTAPRGAARRDCSGTLIVPGNVCAHHHLYSALARGMPYELEPPANFLQILQRVWWRLDRALDAPALRLSALRGGLDALLAGTTTIVDHHASPNAIDGSLDIIAAALEKLGLRSVLCYEVTDRDGPARAAAGVAENLRFLCTTRPLARGMMGAHASFTLSDETLAACVDGAAGAGVGIHIHVAEDGADERDALARSGMRVVERLNAAGAINGASLLAHCVHVDRAEAAVIGASGANVVTNPRSNMNNAVGHSPLGRDSQRLALGTDGIDGDMFTESQAGFFRAKENDVRADPAWPLTRLAEGARFAGRVYGEPLLGTLAPGAPADLTVLEYPVPTPLHAPNLAGHWVFGLSSRQVRDVYVAGELVIADRRSTRVDEAGLAAETAQGAARLWERLQVTAAHPYEPMGGDRR